MKPLSLDLRQRIVDALDAGQSQRSIAQRFCVSTSSVERFARKKRDDTSLLPGSAPGKVPLVSPLERDVFVELAASRTDWTLQSLAEAWQEQTGKEGKSLSAATVLRTLRRMGFTYKKSAASPRSATLPSGKPSESK